MSSPSSKPVPYDSWGTMVDEPIKDREGNTIGYIEDDDVYIYEPDIQEVTRADVLRDIKGWRNDDGTYGNEDVSISIAYDDGTFLSLDDGATKFKRTGIIGAAITTADYEMVWGGNLNKYREFQPWYAHNEDGEEDESLQNVYAGYKATGVYRIRTRVTYNNPNGRGGYTTRRQRLRTSTVKKLKR